MLYQGSDGTLLLTPNWGLPVIKHRLDLCTVAYMLASRNPLARISKKCVALVLLSWLSSEFVAIGLVDSSPAQKLGMVNGRTRASVL